MAVATSAAAAPVEDFSGLENWLSMAGITVGDDDFVHAAAREPLAVLVRALPTLRNGDFILEAAFKRYNNGDDVSTSLKQYMYTPAFPYIADNLEALVKSHKLTLFSRMISRQPVHERLSTLSDGAAEMVDALSRATYATHPLDMADQLTSLVDKYGPALLPKVLQKICLVSNPDYELAAVQAFSEVPIAERAGQLEGTLSDSFIDCVYLAREFAKTSDNAAKLARLVGLYPSTVLEDVLAAVGEESALAASAVEALSAETVYQLIAAVAETRKADTSRMIQTAARIGSRTFGPEVIRTLARLTGEGLESVAGAVEALSTHHDASGIELFLGMEKTLTETDFYHLTRAINTWRQMNLPIESFPEIVEAIKGYSGVELKAALQSMPSQGYLKVTSAKLVLQNPQVRDNARWLASKSVSAEFCANYLSAVLAAAGGYQGSVEMVNAAVRWPHVAEDLSAILAVLPIAAKGHYDTLQAVSKAAINLSGESLIATMTAIKKISSDFSPEEWGTRDTGRIIKSVVEVAFKYSGDVPVLKTAMKRLSDVVAKHPNGSRQVLDLTVAYMDGRMWGAFAYQILKH